MWHAVPYIHPPTCLLLPLAVGALHHLSFLDDAKAELGACDQLALLVKIMGGIQVGGNPVWATDRLPGRHDVARYNMVTHHCRVLHGHSGVR